MKISYDTSLKVAGIALVPWNRLGPERWLPEYKIASLYDWGAADIEDAPELVNLADPNAVDLSRFNSQNLLRTPEFESLLHNQLAGYKLLTYKPVSVPENLKDFDFLMVNESFTSKYENKAFFRQVFADRLPFPDYKVFERSGLGRDQASLDALLDGRDAIVIQDEQLSGGKGTFIVSNVDDYLHAVQTLDAMSQHAKVVVSSKVAGAKERSIQCCVTADAVYSGPLQRQIVRHPALCNMSADGDKFCGAVIVKADQQTPVHQTAGDITQIIGLELQAAGYRGIFGIDFLQDDQGKLFVLEINPRITGVTPLLTALYREGDIPFYLLHILELSGSDYTVQTDPQPFEGEGTLLVLHTLENETVTIKAMPESGTYAIKDDSLVRISGNVHLSKLAAGQFVIQDYVLPGMRVKPGGRLAAVQFNELMLDINGETLYNDALQVIDLVHSKIILESTTSIS